LDHSTIIDSISKINSKEIQPYEQSSGEKSPNLSVNLNSAKLFSQEKYMNLFRSKTDIKSSVQKSIGYRRPNRN
jgi:hypothetical protein